MFPFAKFGLEDLSVCGAALRRMGEGASSMEEVAGRIVRYLQEHLIEGDQPACAMVRFYVLLAYRELPEELQAFARGRMQGQIPSGEMKCLTLLASAGIKPEWNDRRASRGHQALPLPSPEAMAQAPMIAGLIQQLGLDAATVLEAGSPDFIENEERIFNVFHVAQALGSPFIPAQEGFVVPLGIQSVVGFGSLLRSGTLFSIIAFSKASIPRETAELFRVLALSVKVALLPFERMMFQETAPVPAAGDSRQDEQSRLAVLNLLLEVYERTVADQARRLEESRRENERRASDLAQVRRLESVGRLASGVAHEINTPIQFVGDNIHFLEGALPGLLDLVERYRRFARTMGERCGDLEVFEELRQAEAAADLDYIQKEVPRAISQTLEGVERVATIVRAMREFAHPGLKHPAASDLNNALLSTLTVARNELKYIAEVETDLGALPPVFCQVGDLNQVFLNLLINAAQSIQEAVGSTGRRGTIRVMTRREGDMALIAISDTGCGIAEVHKPKIFEPFFTTKEVGQGTGQGLALARAIVVERHRGTITFESQEGKGTTFFIRLPIQAITSPVAAPVVAGA